MCRFFQSIMAHGSSDSSTASSMRPSRNCTSSHDSDGSSDRFWEQGVGGSNPLAPTNNTHSRKYLRERLRLIARAVSVDGNTCGNSCVTRMLSNGQA